MKAFVILAVITILMTLVSCHSQKGFSYERHSRQGKSLKKGAMRRNDVQDLTRWKCSPRKRRH